MVKNILFFLIFLPACMIQNNIAKKSSEQRYLKNTPNQNILFKTSGYYYVFKKTYYNADTGRYISRYFFYQNGKVLYAYDCNDYFDMISKENLLRSSTYLKELETENSYNWTNFQTYGDSIVFEQILPKQFYPHYLFEGRILNDTTFLITHCKRIGRNDRSSENDTFHFRQFSEKPNTNYKKGLDNSPVK